jgi:hypothetical protein
MTKVKLWEQVARGVELGFNVMKETNILCRYKEVLF